MNNRTEYVVIIVDTMAQADAINQALPALPNHKIEAYPVGYGFCGLHYRGVRPTVVIQAHKPLETERERKWERECLHAIGNNKTVWINLSI